jgi:hypothetical protein
MLQRVYFHPFPPVSEPYVAGGIDLGEYTKRVVDLGFGDPLIGAIAKLGTHIQDMANLRTFPEFR